MRRWVRIAFALAVWCGAAAFGLGVNLVIALDQIGRAFMLVSMLLGWVALGAGAVWGTIDVIREPYHLLHHKA